MLATELLRLAEAIAGTGVLLSSLELLWIRFVMSDGHLLSWRIQRLNHPLVATWLARLQVDRLLEYPAVQYLVGLRAVSAASLVAVCATGHDTLWALSIVVATTALWTLRSPQGNDGSDQMAFVVLVACVLGETVGSERAKTATLLFIAAQSALAYATAGFLKIVKAGWRDGSYVLDVLRTASFGNRSILRLAERQRWLAVVLGWGVALGDSAIAFAGLLPPEACAFLLGYGVALHIGIAIVLGLNVFFWSFIATYPAVWAASMWVGQRIWSPLLN